MARPLYVLVTGATGKQGGALARLLLREGNRVRAFTRNADSPGAHELKRQGAEIATGSFEDRDSILRACRDVDAVFAMTTPFEAGTEEETRQGIALAEAAQSAGVKHFVFTSVANADKKTGIPHFESKYRVEQHLATLDLPHTIVAPVFFAENLTSPWWLPGLREGKLAMAMPASRKLQHVALSDIAGFAAVVLENREKFLGRRVDLASFEVTGDQLVETISRLSGRKVRYEEVPIDKLRASNEDFAKMFEWFNRVGYSADIAGLRRSWPQVGWQDLEGWARKQDWKTLLGKGGAS